jgi:hypothetical protein
MDLTQVRRAGRRRTPAFFPWIGIRLVKPARAESLRVLI